jgi:hypothetical protein
MTKNVTINLTNTKSKGSDSIERILLAAHSRLIARLL